MDEYIFQTCFLAFATEEADILLGKNEPQSRKKGSFRQAKAMVTIMNNERIYPPAPVLNSQQRAKLRSLASTMSSVTQIGKGGVGEAMVKSISDALEARELIKISVLENSAETARGAGEEIAKLTGSEVVAVIGRKIILYKVSSKPENRKISATL